MKSPPKKSVWVHCGDPLRVGGIVDLGSVPKLNPERKKRKTDTPPVDRSVLDEKQKREPGPWIEFSVPTRPVSKARPRLSGFHVYTPAGTLNYQKLIANYFIVHKAEMKSNLIFPFHGPIELELIFRSPPPRVPEIRQKSYPSMCDVDNAAKAIMDALNQVAWVDDQQIVSLYARKEFGENAVCVKFRSLSGM